MAPTEASAGKAGFEGTATDTPPPAAAPKKDVKYKTIAEILAELWGITAAEIYANAPNTALFNNLTYIDSKADFVYVDQPALGISNIEITRDSVMIDDPITMETAMQLAAIAAANPAIRAQGVVTVGRNERETHLLTIAALYYKLDIKNPAPVFDDHIYSDEFKAAEKSVNGVAEVPPQLIPQEPVAGTTAPVETAAAETSTPAAATATPVETAPAETAAAAPSEPAKPAFTELNDDIREALYDQYLDTPTSSPATEGLSKEEFLALLDKRWAAMQEKEREFYALQSKDYRQSKEPLPFDEEAGRAYVMNVYGMNGIPGRERDKIAARWTALPRDIQNQYLETYREFLKQLKAAQDEKLAAEANPPAEAAAPAAVAAAPVDPEFKDKLEVEILDSPNLDSLPFDEKAQKAYIDYLIQIKKDTAHAEMTDTHKVNWVRLSTDSQKKILLRAGAITREEFEGKQPEAPAIVAPAPAEAAAEAVAPAAAAPAAPEAVSDNVLKRPLTEQVAAILKAAKVRQSEYKQIRRRVVEGQKITRSMISTEFNLVGKDIDAVYKALQEEQIIRRQSNKQYAVIPAEDGHARPAPV